MDADYSIWKFPAKVTDQFMVEMPIGASLVSVQVQTTTGEICIWALVNTKTINKDKRYFRCYGTGHPIDIRQLKQYVGTVQRGMFVWHFYEIYPPKEDE